MGDKHSGESYNPSLSMRSSLELQFDRAHLTVTGSKNDCTYSTASGNAAKDGNLNHSKAAQADGPRVGFRVLMYQFEAGRCSVRGTSWSH